jgi:hypothetical protein
MFPSRSSRRIHSWPELPTMSVSSKSKKAMAAISALPFAGG